MKLIEQNAFTYGVKIILAIVILFIGFQIIKLLVKFADKGLEKSNVDKSIRPFLKSILSIGLKLIMFLSIAGTFGIKTTSFVAILASAGLAFGLALQGSLSNFAGGILILLFKPFEVDDYIEAQGIEGTVKEIQLFFSKVLKLNGETVFIPNGVLANGNIVNFSKEGQLRLNIPIGVSYSADLFHVRKIISQVMRDNHLVKNTPEPDVVVSELADNSVNLLARPWVSPQHKPAVTAQILEEIKLKLDENNVEIPFPQTVVHLQQ
ncbi:UNVERIFIED_CONTAM: hypothetical protein GTU68_013439 [Idotea baltica]|nr:hypothetical protein [Idotea baltica]